MANQPRGGGRGATRTDTDRRLTKAERKDEARRQREEIRRRQAARRRNRTIAIVAGGVVVAAAVVLIVMNAGRAPNSAVATGSSSPVPQSELQGVLTTQPPWPDNTADLAQRLQVLGLPGVSDVINHHHARLWIYVNGQQVTIPADIGLSQTVGSPLHTHLDNGVIHIEADDPNFQGTLGQFFDVWGVRFDRTCVGGVCDSGDQTWHVYVDGKPYVGDPAQLALSEHQAIVLAYGTKDQLPNPLPDNFDFGGAPQV